jgi:hypothetical protein
MSATAISLAIELALQLLTRSQQISTVVAAAQAAGRDHLTPEEWSAITSQADDARAALVAAIAKAKG